MRANCGNNRMLRASARRSNDVAASCGEDSSAQSDDDHSVPRAAGRKDNLRLCSFAKNAAPSAVSELNRRGSVATARPRIAHAGRCRHRGCLSGRFRPPQLATRAGSSARDKSIRNIAAARPTIGAA